MEFRGGTLPKMHKTLGSSPRRRNRKRYVPQLCVDKRQAHTGKCSELVCHLCLNLPNEKVLGGLWTFCP